MLLICHIVIALTSLVATFLTVLIPSKFKLNVSKILIVLTLLSGTILVVVSHANMISACVSGLVYTALVSAGFYESKRRLLEKEC